MGKSIWSDFTNQYSLSKTLRFELKPSKISKESVKKVIKKNDLLSCNNTDELIERIEEVKNDYAKDYKLICEIFSFLENLDERKEIFVNREFLRNLYKYANIKDNVEEPKTGNKIQPLLIKDISKYLENYKQGNIRGFQYELEELGIIIKNYKNGKGSSDTGLPKKTEIFQKIRKLAWLYIKVWELFGQFEMDFVWRDSYQNGKAYSFNPQLKRLIEDFKSSNDLYKISQDFLETLTLNHGLCLGSFSLNKYAVNNFKEIVKLEGKINEKKKEYKLLKNKKFIALRNREKAYWKKWKKITAKQEYKILRENRTNSNKGDWDNALKSLKKQLSKDLEKLYKGYRDAAVKFGNCRKELISLQREFEEITFTKYFGRIVKESDDKFYLVLVPRLDNENKKKRLDDLDVLKNEFIKDGDLEVLDFHKITFSAFEKLFLLGESSLRIEKSKDIKQLWKEIKYKRFEGNQRENINKLTDFIEDIVNSFSDLFRDFSFNFQKLKSAKNFREFEKEFDKQGYHIQYEKINKKRLWELEKNGEILFFQIYCKDMLLSEEFAISEKDKKKINWISTGKENLHTRYWKSFFNNIGSLKYYDICRIFGDGKIYYREKELEENILVGNRFQDDKFFVSFGFQINPNAIDVRKNVRYDNGFQQKHIDDVNQRINTELKNADQFYCIGLDQGVNSLVSYCVLDKEGNVMKDEYGQLEIGDLSLVISTGNRKGEFIEVEDTIIVNGDKGVWDEESMICKLEEANDRVLKNDKRVKVCDYAEKIYVETYKRKKEIENYDVGDSISFDKVTDLKKGYVSHVIHKIEQLANKYSPAIIAIEFLKDQKNRNGLQNKNPQEINNDPKYNNPKKSRFGTSTIECLENALLEKFGFWNGKVVFSRNQFVPKIIKKSDFYKKDTQWGNIFIVDESNTSSLCPECGEKGNRTKVKREGNEDIYGSFRGAKDILTCECGWDSEKKKRSFHEIRNGDDLASYNIAKRALELLGGYEDKNVKKR